MNDLDWHSAGNAWLCKCTSQMYNTWKIGKTTKQKNNPYKHGFSLPQWVHNAIAALNAGNEKAFKAIKMIESQYTREVDNEHN